MLTVSNPLAGTTAVNQTSSDEEYEAQLGAGTPEVAVALTKVEVVYTQEELTVNETAEHGSSFEGGGGGEVIHALKVVVCPPVEEYV